MHVSRSLELSLAEESNVNSFKSRIASTGRSSVGDWKVKISRPPLILRDEQVQGFFPMISSSPGCHWARHGDYGRVTQ
jgi:hypothetical protein